MSILDQRRSWHSQPCRSLLHCLSSFPCCDLPGSLGADAGNAEAWQARAPGTPLAPWVSSRSSYLLPPSCHCPWTTASAHGKSGTFVLSQRDSLVCACRLVAGTDFKGALASASQSHPKSAPCRLHDRGRLTSHLCALGPHPQLCEDSSCTCSVY